MNKIATCLHCKGQCRLTDGKEVYPHRTDLHEKPIWKCDPCKATVGCHSKTTNALGYAANKETRQARMKLHNQRLDLFWKESLRKKLTNPPPEMNRGDVYLFLQERMGLSGDECHTGKFTIDQCRMAWIALGTLWKGQ